MTDRRPVFGLRGGVGFCMKISPSELQALYILRSDMLFEEIMAYGSFLASLRNLTSVRKCRGEHVLLFRSAVI